MLSRLTTSKLFALVPLLAAMLCMPAPLRATTDGQGDAGAARQQLLAAQAFTAWTEINRARQNPRAVVERLEIPLEQAEAVLGEDAWILDEGLPAVAWNDQLTAASQAHGADMFGRLYYSHTSPEGYTAADRVAFTGYQAALVDETLAALVFDSYFDVTRAVEFMIDTMLRDELTGTPGVRRNIFSPQLTEVGISFFAESVPLLAGEPYIYLFVLDFATPVEPRNFLVVEAGEGVQPLLLPSFTATWQALPVITAGTFQVPYPQDGAELVLVNEGPLQRASETILVYDQGRGMDNVYLDLRDTQLVEMGSPE